jgi:hypothetical protein
MKDNYTQTVADAALQPLRTWLAAEPGRTKILLGLLFAKT